MPEGVASSSPEHSGLHPGVVVGGRFEVVDRVDEDLQSVVWSAKDQQTKRAILVHVLRPELVPPQSASQFRDACRMAANLSHRNIAKTFGVGRTEKGEHFIAGEWIEGARLSDFIAERQRNGQPLSLRGSYNVVANLCSALSYAEDKGPHGTLRPSSVWVTRGGRVKVRDFGTGRILLEVAGADTFSEEDRACLAPEVRKGAPPSTRSDVFGIGAILYELLTGRVPGASFVPPSHVRDDIPAEIDGAVFRCLALDPRDRFDSPDALLQALAPFVQEANSVPPSPDEASFPLPSFPVTMSMPAGPRMPSMPTFDVDLASVLPPPEMNIPGVPEGFPKAFAVSKDPPAEDPSKTAPTRDLRVLLERLSSDSKQRWMVDQDGMDHGPFNARELIERLNVGGFSGQDATLNLDLAERKPLREWPEFTEFVVQREHQNVLAAEHAARTNAQKSEKRSSAAKWMIAVSLVAVIGASVGGFLLSRSSDFREASATALDDLFQLGDIPTGEAGLLPDQPVRRRKKGSGGGSPAPTPRRKDGLETYEDAMNRAVELGDASQGGAEGRLSGAQVASVMNANLNRFYGKCVIPAQKSGARLGKVTVDLAIAGSGSVLGASVRGGDPTFHGCMGRAISNVRFPTFGAPRMGARYSFTVD